MSTFTLRPALESESGQIKALIHLVGINPMGLDWKRFIVAVSGQGVVTGCGQIKPHGEDICELASIAVHPDHQGQGIARAIMERLIAETPKPLYLMCMSKMELFYNKFGFTSLAAANMPRYFQRIYRVFQVADMVRRSGEELLIMKME